MGLGVISLPTLVRETVAIPPSQLLSAEQHTL